jgi:esterase/lipase
MEKSVTISCRVTPEIKMQLVQKSEALGMMLCNYIELLVLNQFDKEIKEESQTVNENQENEKSLIEPTFQALISHLTDDVTQVEVFEKHFNILQEKHDNSKEVELVNACLIHAIKNDKALWQRNLSVFLNRLKDGEYDD